MNRSSHCDRLPGMKGAAATAPATISASSRGVAQPGSATALGAVGRTFESSHPDHSLTPEPRMKRLLVAPCSAAFVALLIATAILPAAAQAQDPAASAPADARARAVQRSLPVQSPAIGAVDKAQTPGDLRPERRVSPQIAVPLTPEGRVIRGRSQDARVKPAQGGIDDRAARCRAMKTAAERNECAAALKSSESPGK